jgi:heme a synthase
MRWPLVALLVLGGMQAFIGWFMVQSGLTVRLDVSQYRLAMHLSMAFLILGGLVWLALASTQVGGAKVRLRTMSRTQFGCAILIAALIFLQVIGGAFVAGLKAGLTYNTWPLMDGHVIPSGLGTLQPWYLNVFENVTTVQFNHRLLAYIVALVVVAHAVSVIRLADDERLRQSAGLLLVAVALQVVLGIWTLLAGVPVHLGVIHQTGAAILFALATRHIFLMRAALR